MYIKKAILCLDCDWIHIKKVCPKCGSSHQYEIRKWIAPLDMSPRCTRPNNVSRGCTRPPDVSRKTKFMDTK